jgi:hypothetical protein
MTMAGHSKGNERGQFCSLRMEECPCGNKYKDVMEEGGVPSWGKYVQKHRKLKFVERSPEAHHVLPVASVTANVTANKKIRDEVVENTKWCVNDKPNMIALPLFEMTFTHYLVNHDSDSNTPISAPPFAGLPMHNYGHAAFQKEVGKELERVGEDAQENTQNHEDASKTLLSALNQARGDFMADLKSRGKRGKGTHVEFLNAMGRDESGKKFEGGSDKWYVPFSMAEEPAYRAFPSKTLKTGLSKKLNDLVKALADWSAST